jgi:pentatricopeptide repeat protein
MNARKMDEVCRLMGRMIDQGNTISCNCIFEGLCEAGRTADANQLRVLSKERGFGVDDNTYSMLVQGFGRQGKGRKARLLWLKCLIRDIYQTLPLTIDFLVACVREEIHGNKRTSQRT